MVYYQLKKKVLGSFSNDNGMAGKTSCENEDLMHMIVTVLPLFHRVRIRHCWRSTLELGR